jgi:hypothetical protein
VNGPSIPTVAVQLLEELLLPPLAAALLVLLLLLLLPHPAATSAVSASAAVIIRPFTALTSSSGESQFFVYVDSGGAPACAGVPSG